MNNFLNKTYFLEYLIAGFLNIVVTIFLIRLIVKAFLGFKSIFQSSRQEQKVKESDIDEGKNFQEVQLETVHDTVCDSYVLKEDAYIAVVDNKRHYFCSWECRQKFIENMKKQDVVKDIKTDSIQAC